MPTMSIFDYSFLNYLGPSGDDWAASNSMASSSEEETSFLFGSPATATERSEGEIYMGGADSYNTQMDGDIVSHPYFFQTDHHQQQISTTAGPSVAALAAAVASATINATMSAISSTLGVDNYLESSFSHDRSEDASGNGSFGNSTLASMLAGGHSTASYSSGGTLADQDQPHQPLHEGSAPLLKLASSVIPENFRKLSANSRNCVIAYVILFCIGAPGNLFVFISVGREIWRRQLMRSRIKVLIWHLATADLFVCFVVIPVEIFWRLTIQWYGGDALCKLAQFFRAFGLYLSSMVIICISLDRFCAIVFPLKVIGGMKRVRNMLCIAWSSAILFAAPQILVFSVQRHPLYPSFLLCSNSDYFLSLSKEIMYNLLSLIVMYFAPLLVIIVTYAMVLYTIARKSREHHQDCRPRSGSNQLRRSDNASNIARARRKTLWLSMVIVTVFVICWTPYVTMTLWYMFDFETADKIVDPQIHEAFFVTAVSNSCVNPIIYGNYMKKYWRNLRNAACRSRNSSTSSSRIVSSSRAHHGGPISQHNHHHHNHHHHRGASTYRCTNPTHHFNLSPRCQSGGNASDVTIVLKEFPPCQLGRSATTTTTTTTNSSSRSNWF